MPAQALICLASQSPRRRELLAQIGVHPVTLHVDVDERVVPGEAPEQYVARLAAAKAVAGWQAQPVSGRLPALGADTAVVAGGQILGKPRDRDDALAMLDALSGRTHRVLTAVALARPAVAVLTSASRVTFRTLGRAEAAAYWATGEPADKAGGYAIQGLAAQFIARLEGSYSGVMGLPLYETAQLLGEAGMDLLPGVPDGEPAG